MRNAGVNSYEALLFLCVCMCLFVKLQLKTDLVFGDLQQGIKFSMNSPVWSTGLSGCLEQCSG